MAMNVLLSGAVVGYFVHTGCDILDAHRERKKRMWRQEYEKAEKKKAKMAKKATHHHHHYHLEGRHPRYLTAQPHWPDYEYDNGQTRQLQDYRMRNGPQGHYQHRQDHYHIEDQFTRNAGLLESGQIQSEPDYRRRALPSPETIVTNAADHDTTSSAQQLPNAHNTEPQSTQQSRSVPSGSNDGSRPSPNANEIASMTYQQLQELDQDPNLDEESRKAIRRRIMEWQMFYFYYQQQQQQQHQSNSHAHQALQQHRRHQRQHQQQSPVQGHHNFNHPYRQQRQVRQEV